MFVFVISYIYEFWYEFVNSHFLSICLIINVAVEWRFFRFDILMIVLFGIGKCTMMTDTVVHGCQSPPGVKY